MSIAVRIQSTPYYGTKSDMPLPSTSSDSCVQKKQLIAKTENKKIQTFLCWDVALGDRAKKRSAHAACECNGMLIVIGGFDGELV